MGIKGIRCTILLLLFSSCALWREGPEDGSLASKTPSYQFEYALSDKSGNFLVFRESGREEKNRSFVIKEKIVPEKGDKNHPLEKAIVFSDIGTLGGRPVFRPKASQYAVWFEGEKHLSETKLNSEEKSMTVKFSSQNGGRANTREIPFPQGNGLFCYFLQVIECAGHTGFIEKAMEKKTGQMNFHIIWEGYPFVGEQYPIPEELFSEAKLSYDGMMMEGGYRFSLETAGQTLFYFVNNEGQMTRKLWISQGYSLLKKDKSQ